MANLLLRLESSVADKVPALILTGAYADALAVAMKELATASPFGGASETPSFEAAPLGFTSNLTHNQSLPQLHRQGGSGNERIKELVVCHSRKLQ